MENFSIEERKGQTVVEQEASTKGNDNNLLHSNSDSELDAYQLTN